MPLITFEGIDGAGKSSVINLVSTKLWVQKQVCVRLNDFSDHSPAAASLKAPMKQDMLPLSQYDMILTARRLIFTQCLGYMLQQGDVVLYDRYIDSTTCYQGAMGMNPNRIMEDHLARGFPLPDLTIYLDVPIEVARNRIRERPSGPIDTIEQRHDSYFVKVRQNYLRLQQAGHARHVKVDADRPLPLVVADCLALIRERVLDKLPTPAQEA